MAVLQSTVFDVIVLDLALGNGSGLQTLSTLLDRAGATPVIVITGDDGEDTAFEAMARGAHDCLIKGSLNEETIARSVRFAFERSRAEAQRRMEALETTDQLRRRYELILNSIADGVHGIDAEGNITFENAASARMLGWTPEELTGKPAHKTIHYAHADGSRYDGSKCPILATMQDGVVRHVSDDVFWRRDGTSFRIEYVAAPKIASHGEMVGVVVAFRDITKKREMQFQVDQAIRVSSLGRAAASIAHEFNNVLMAVQPFCEILLRQIGDDTVLQKPLKHIMDGIKRGRAISHQILRFASPASPRLVSLDLGAWVSSFGDEARLTLKDRMLHIGPAESLIVRADPEQLSQVMLNLVTNARDASPAGATVTISVVHGDTVPFLRERLDAPERFASLVVRDRGEGIPAEVLEHIFEPLFTTKRSGGTGLGLTVAQQIVSEHGGKIIVESVAGAGTAFYVALPLEEESFTSPSGGGETPMME
jgi:PAS domain S-box-containing protein